MEEDGEVAIFSVDETITRERRKEEGKPKGDGKVSELDHAVLGSGKYQSEGVEDKMMFVKGGEEDGKHKNIESNRISQGSRQLWGGKQVSSGSRGFGPRDREKEIKQLKETKEKMRGQSYWPIIQEAGKYVSEEDLRGISEKGRTRDLNLETQILELYKERSWGERQMGKAGNKVDLTLNLEILKKILNTDEENLKKNKGNYGELANNGKLKLVRVAGNLEGVAGNYFRKFAGKNEPSLKSLKEKNLIDIVFKLMTGDVVGFDCSQDKKGQLIQKVFKECTTTLGSEKDKFQVKAVLKSVIANHHKKVPIKEGGGGGARQYDAKNEGKQIYNDNFDDSKVINEKCEPDNIGSGFSDLELKIRQEVCDLPAVSIN